VSVGSEGCLVLSRDDHGGVLVVSGGVWEFSGQCLGCLGSIFGDNSNLVPFIWVSALVSTQIVLDLGSVCGV
jgi:hypothetical protein